MKTKDDNNLLDQGVLLPDGSASKDKLNLLSGAHTSEFVEALWITSDCDGCTMQHIYALLAKLYSEGKYEELLDVIRRLYNTVEMEVPDSIAALCSHREALRYFLFEFLLDFEDMAQELMDEADFAEQTRSLEN